METSSMTSSKEDLLLQRTLLGYFSLEDVIETSFRFSFIDNFFLSSLEDLIPRVPLPWKTSLSYFSIEHLMEVLMDAFFHKKSFMLFRRLLLQTTFRCLFLQRNTLRSCSIRNLVVQKTFEYLMEVLTEAFFPQKLSIKSIEDFFDIFLRRQFSMFISIKDRRPIVEGHTDILFF